VTLQVAVFKFHMWTRTLNNYLSMTNTLVFTNTVLPDHKTGCIKDKNFSVLQYINAVMFCSE